MARANDERRTRCLKNDCPMPVYIQIVAAVFIPVFGAWLLWQQVQIARMKLQLDLFDKRFVVFEAARKFLLDIVTHGTTSDDALRAYVLGTIDSVFLLNDELADYLKEIRNRAIRLRAIMTTADAKPVGTERTALVQAGDEHFQWLNEQADVLQEKFMPFLKFDQLLWLWPHLPSLRQRRHR